MADLWQEHRRFIVTLLAGGLVFLIAYLLIDGIYSDDIQQSQLLIARFERTQRMAPGGDLEEARDEQARVVEEFERLRRGMDRRPAEGFKVGPDVSEADLHFNMTVAKVRQEMLEPCALRNITVDRRLGLPDSIPGTRGQKDWYLRGLDVVYQVLALVLEADSVLEGGIARVEDISIAGMDSRDETAGSRFVELLPVSLDIVGHPRAVDRVLRVLPQPDPNGRYLALLSGSIESLDEPPDARRRGQRDSADAERVVAHLELSPVFINEEAAGAETVR